MNRNIGTVDRLMRCLLGLLVFAGAYIHRESYAAGRILAWVGLFLVVRAIFRWDPLYNIVGINTANKE